MRISRPFGLYCRAQANTAWYNSALKRSSTASSGEKPASLKTSPVPKLGFFIPHVFAAVRVEHLNSSPHLASGPPAQPQTDFYLFLNHLKRLFRKNANCRISQIGF